MTQPEGGRPWFASPYTGLFSQCGPVPSRPHDPAVFTWAGVLPRWGRSFADLAVGGVGWSRESAQGAGVGEAVERWRSRPEPGDVFVESSCADWPLAEPVVAPARWVLFHPDQYATTGFPYVPFVDTSVCRWYCCREVLTGEPHWVPGWQLFLESGEGYPYGPSLSTGLAAGRAGDPVLLRGLQEVVERDALVGGWWGLYQLEEHDARDVLASLPAQLPSRLCRPNLLYRCYRIVTPFSSHVTLVTLQGADHEGVLFSTGSACRETRQASWQKAFLEAVQGRHYVRQLRGVKAAWPDPPADFAGHALHYTLHPDRLHQTVLERAASGGKNSEQEVEGLSVLAERLGPSRPVLFRLLTPGALAPETDWVVARVLVPGLQPLHGHHGQAFLGGALGRKWSVGEWQRSMPHPFA